MTIKKIRDYALGHIRHFLFYNKRLNWLLPLHIFEQISYRIYIMDQDCLTLGHCKLCGCTTPHKQMANSSCPKPCYPKMMDKDTWTVFKRMMGIWFKYPNFRKKREFQLQITPKK